MYTCLSDSSIFVFATGLCAKFLVIFAVRLAFWNAYIFHVAALYVITYILTCTYVLPKYMCMNLSYVHLFILCHMLYVDLLCTGR